MDSYIVRVYRRFTTEPRTVLGIIENVEQQEKHVFRSLDELWDALNSGCALSRNAAEERDLNDLLKGKLDGVPLAEPLHRNKSNSQGRKLAATNAKRENK